jgi:hypothetical protein
MLAGLPFMRQQQDSGSGSSSQMPSLLGGLMSYIGQRDSNRHAAKAAEQQMRFQEHMSNTAHQRQVKDLEAAGLNPLLATNTGASSPQGATSQAQNALGAGVTSALETKQMQLNVKRLNQEIKNMKAAEKESREKAKTQQTVQKLNDVNTTSAKQNIDIKGAAQRVTDVFNWLFDSVGNKDSRFNKSTYNRKGKQ